MSPHRIHPFRAPLPKARSTRPGDSSRNVAPPINTQASLRAFVHRHAHTPTRGVRRGKALERLSCRTTRRTTRAECGTACVHVPVVWRGRLAKK